MEGVPKIFISRLVVKCLIKRISLSVSYIKHVRNVRDYRRPVFLELPITSQRQQTKIPLSNLQTGLLID